MAAYTVRAQATRASSAYEVIRFVQGEQFCRPRRSSALEAAEAWITGVMDDDTAGDYATGEEGEAEMIPDVLASPSVAPETSELEFLRQRVAELEKRQSRAEATKGVSASTPPATPGPTSQGLLFGGNRALSGDRAALEKLKQLAGAAPTRLGAHERDARARRPEQILEALQQEEGLEAVEPGEMDESLQKLEEELTDPIQKLLLLQMKQLQMMSQQQSIRKGTDPIQQALGGGGSSESASAASGIKGCLAREAYIKVAADLERLKLKISVSPRLSWMEFSAVSFFRLR